MFVTVLRVDAWYMYLLMLRLDVLLKRVLHLEITVKVQMDVNMSFSVCYRFCIEKIFHLDIVLPLLWHVLVSITYGTNISHIKGNSTLVLMHKGIVNGHRLLCNAHIVFEPHRGTAALFLFTYYRPYPLFLFMCLSL